MMTFAIIISPYHPTISNGLVSGALSFLTDHAKINRSNIDLFEAPGAFEMPLIAKHLARTKKYRGIICLGAVIKGETAHFEYISEATAHGLMQVSLEFVIPVSFGVLTTYTEEQALARSSPNEYNKGLEAARACFQAAHLIGTHA